jgi:hypothetical protein
MPLFTVGLLTRWLRAASPNGARAPVGATSTPESRAVQTLLKAAVERRGVPVLFISPLGHSIDTAFWIAVPTDQQRDRLAADADLATEFHRIFEDSGYLALVHAQWDKDWRRPQYDDKVRHEMAYQRHPSVTIESQESVDREQGGNWWHRMK